MRHRVPVRVMALGLLLISGRIASAQQVVYAAGVSPLDSATQAALRSEMSRAQSRGLPVEPLEA